MMRHVLCVGEALVTGGGRHIRPHSPPHATRIHNEAPLIRSARQPVDHHTSRHGERDSDLNTGGHVRLLHGNAVCGEETVAELWRRSFHGHWSRDVLGMVSAIRVVSDGLVGGVGLNVRGLDFIGLPGCNAGAESRDVREVSAEVALAVSPGSGDSSCPLTPNLEDFRCQSVVAVCAPQQTFIWHTKLQPDVYPPVARSRIDGVHQDFEGGASIEEIWLMVVSQLNSTNLSLKYDVSRPINLAQTLNKSVAEFLDVISAEKFATPCETLPMISGTEKLCVVGGWPITDGSRYNTFHRSANALVVEYSEFGLRENGRLPLLPVEPRKKHPESVLGIELG